MSRHGLLLLLAAFAAAPLTAQSPAQRSQLAAWVDSLERRTTVADLEQLSPGVSGTDKGVQQLRRALYNSRRGELGRDRGALEKALFDFDQASARHRSWPWPEYGMARVFKALHFGRYVASHSEGQFEGESFSEATWRHLRTALERDATMSTARDLAIELLTHAGDRPLAPVHRRALELLLGTRTTEPDAFLVSGRVLRGRTRFDSALAAFDESLRLGGDRSRLALERARTLSAEGDSTAAALAYWSGVKGITAVGRQAYRADLAWIVSPDSLAEFDATTPDSLGPWLERFWGLRDIRSAKSSDGRLMEHLRRWAIAFANFKVTAPWRRTMFTRIEFGFEGRDACISSNPGFYERLARMPPVDSLDLRSREPLLDHRGLIYLRHGDPLGRQGLSTATGPSSIDTPGPTTGELSFSPSPSWVEQQDLRDSQGGTEVWLYFLEGDWRILFFRGSKALGTGAGTTLSSYIPIPFAREWWAAAQLLPKYGPAADRIAYYMGIQPKSCLPEVTAAVAESREGALAGITSDSDAPPITSPWNAALDIFSVGSARDVDGRALITFAIPVAELSARRPDAERFAFDVHFRISAFERGSGRRIQLDTVRHFSSTIPPKAGQHLSGLFELPLEAGLWDLSVLVDQGDAKAGAFAEIRNRRIAVGTRLAVSDLVTGVAGSRMLWNANGTSFPLNVLGAWTPRSPLELYYEIYGLPEGSGYSEKLELRPAAGQPGKGITIGTAGQSTGLTTVVRRSVGLTQLRPGRYRVIVTVTHGTESVVTERPLLVVKQ